MRKSIHAPVAAEINAIVLHVLAEAGIKPSKVKAGDAHNTLYNTTNPDLKVCVGHYPEYGVVKVDVALRTQPGVWHALGNCVRTTVPKEGDWVMDQYRLSKSSQMFDPRFTDMEEWCCPSTVIAYTQELAEKLGVSA